MDEKECTKCKNIKSLQEFHRRKHKYASHCKDCRKIETRKRYEKNLKNTFTRTRTHDCTGLEFKAIELLVPILSKTYEVRRVNEWCLADMCIRPIDSKDDSWVMIQVKATQGKGPIGYQFALRKNYPECIVLLVSLDDHKIWNIDNTISVNTITIGEKSKYDEFIVKKEDLVESLNKRKVKKFTLDEINTPINKNHKLESEYAKTRQQLPYKFEYPHREGMKYDFLLHGLKVQEKIGRKDPASNFSYRFHVTAGNDKRYTPDDVDIFWFHFPDKIHFAVIPYREMLEKNIFEKTNFSLNLNKSEWYSKYINDYDCFQSLRILVEQHMPNKTSYNETRDAISCLPV